ncbi:DUF1835 domain-containing protein [Tellurirhabdus rosea]|uniref:DUF1835 domain-containing protein n=1 Tax=Tellurirhabdus rosea TaxID=2674997 RepID=UPI00225657CE|nr:DUF1835 domain-containing protein [Tellurirhabdus rosea]
MTLHILNGDASLRPFQEAGFAGDDVLVWREMLSEGPVRADAGMTEFWDIRRHYIGGPEAASYDQQVVREFDRLQHLTRYDEVVLWFEHDLFCQINLIFLLMRLERIDRGGIKLSIIHVDEFRPDPAFKGIGQLNGGQFRTLYAQRRTLTDADLALASRAWFAYAGPDPLAIPKFLAAEATFGNLPYLPEALRAHLQRFPFVGNGLNLIETQLLTIVLEGPMPESELVRRFLHQDHLFGMGDVGVMQYIRGMSPHLLRRTDHQVELTPEGADIATGRKPHAPAERWLGGYHQAGTSPYRWNGEKLIV